MGNHEPEIKQPMEKGIPEEISDFVDQIPIPIFIFVQYLTVPFWQNGQVSMWKACSSEKCFKKDLVIFLRIDQRTNYFSIWFFLEFCFKSFKGLFILSCHILFLTVERFFILKGGKNFRTLEFIIQQWYFFKKKF